MVPRKKKVRYPRKIAGVKKVYLWNKDPVITVASASLSRAEDGWDARRRSSSGVAGGGEWSSCSLDEEGLSMRVRGVEV